MYAGIRLDLVVNVAGSFLMTLDSTLLRDANQYIYIYIFNTKHRKINTMLCEVLNKPRLIMRTTNISFPSFLPRENGDDLNVTVLISYV